MPEPTTSLVINTGPLIALYAICRSGPLRRDFGLRDQITRSAVSVMANIAEGFGRKTNAVAR